MSGQPNGPREGQGRQPNAAKPDDNLDDSWETPRWRHRDVTAQRVVERERRFRNMTAPGQAGAIDDDRTIARQSGWGGRPQAGSSDLDA